MSNCIETFMKEGNSMMKNATLKTLKDVETQIDMAFEMAKSGNIDSAIAAVSVAHNRYKCNTETSSRPVMSSRVVIVDGLMVG